jgi:hypothetical protein
MTVAALICLANTEEERRLLAVRFGGERRTTKLAAILNLTHLPIAEQRKQVKRATDRLMLRVRRHVRARCPRR